VQTAVFASSADASQRSRARVTGSWPPNASGYRSAAETHAWSDWHPAIAPSTLLTVSDPGSIAIAWAIDPGRWPLLFPAGINARRAEFGDAGA
jgi:hypothetical protein